MKSIAINQFLNSEDKKIDNNLKVIIDKIAKIYSIEYKIYKTDKRDIIISKVKYFTIIKFFQKLWWCK